MATLPLITGNSKIKAWMDYSYSRSDYTYSIKYKICMQRTNTYSGTPTSGRIDYDIYLNNVVVYSATGASFEVPNDKSEAVLKEWTYVYPPQAEQGEEQKYLDPFTEYKYTVGFYSHSPASGNNHITAFDIDKTTSKSDTIPAYTTKVTANKVDIKSDEGSNAFTLTTTVPEVSSDGRNTINQAVVLYTTDGSNPLDRGDTVQIYYLPPSQAAGGDTWTILSTSISANTTVKAVMEVEGTYNYDSKSNEATLNYYSPPTWSSGSKVNVNIAPKPKKPTPKSIYTVSWPKANNGSNNIVDKYILDIDICQETVETKEFGSQTTSCVIDGTSLPLSKDDELVFTIRAIGKSQYYNASNWLFSPHMIIVNAGTIKYKTNNAWKEALVWQKVNGQWTEITDTFIKNNGQWKNSV